MDNLTLNVIKYGILLLLGFIIILIMSASRGIKGIVIIFSALTVSSLVFDHCNNLIYSGAVFFSIVVVGYLFTKSSHH